MIHFLWASELKGVFKFRQMFLSTVLIGGWKPRVYSHFFFMGDVVQSAQVCHPVFAAAKSNTDAKM